MKKFIKYIGRTILGLVAIYIGLITYTAFNLDVLHNYNKEDHYCLIPGFSFCFFIVGCIITLFYYVWYKTKDW